MLPLVSSLDNWFTRVENMVLKKNTVRISINDLPRFGLVASMEEFNPDDVVIIPFGHIADRNSLHSIFWERQCEHINDVCIIKGWAAFYDIEMSGDVVLAFKRIQSRGDRLIISIDGQPIN